MQSVIWKTLYHLKPMALTSRKKRPLNRNLPHLRDTKLIIIATEGKETEKQYFLMFKNLKLQVKIIPATDNRSSPEYVLNRLDNFKKEFNIDGNDELWLVVDVDRWGDAKLSQIAKLCVQKNYHLAISNPCFEVWLYLHFENITPEINNCQEVKRLIKNRLGSYNSSNLNTDIFLPNVNVAVENAKVLDTNPQDRWTSSTGTHVYKIVEKLI